MPLRAPFPLTSGRKRPTERTRPHVRNEFPKRSNCADIDAQLRQHKQAPYAHLRISERSRPSALAASANIEVHWSDGLASIEERFHVEAKKT